MRIMQGASLALLVASVSSVAGLNEINSVRVDNSFSCSNIQVDGATYDLSPLNKEWSVEGRIPLRFNPCKPINYSNEACPKGKSYMCAMDPSNPSLGRADVGSPRELYRNPKNELVMMFSSGSYDMNGFPFVSLVRFECDPAASYETGPFEPYADGSKYFLVWRSKAACPKSVSLRGYESMGMIGSLFTLLIVGLTLYCVIGMAYNIVQKGKPLGIEAMPHSSFWMDVFDFVRELSANIVNRLRGGSGGYQRI